MLHNNDGYRFGESMCVVPTEIDYDMKSVVNDVGGPINRTEAHRSTQWAVAQRVDRALTRLRRQKDIWEVLDGLEKLEAVLALYNSAVE
jgi:hypothetical protein